MFHHLQSESIHGHDARQLVAKVLAGLWRSQGAAPWHRVPV